MKSLRTFSLLLAALLIGGSSLRAQGPGPRPYPDRLAWWADARFGIFLHWGPVSLKGTEISWSRANTNPKCPNRGPIPAAEYDTLYQRFNPTNFDAKQWVRLAKAAGIKYMVLTAKHCDGFLLWDSQVSDYNIMHTPFHRDVCGELARAAHEQGMRIGWYFSPMDWRDPDCRSANHTRFVARMQAELGELLTRYGRIDLLWFDYDGGEAAWDQERTYALVQRLQPRIVINNRLDMGPGRDAGSPNAIGPHGDYFTPEQSVGRYEDQHPWESCMTLSRRGQWAWGGHEDGVKTLEELMEMLIRCPGGDGNLLLNAGPMPTGEIAIEQAGRLKKLGAWLHQYGESIYGTRGGPFKPGEYGVSTRKGDTIYLHICDWPDDTLTLPGFIPRIVSSRVLGGGRVQVYQTRTAIDVVVPEADRRPIDTIVALKLTANATALPAMDVPSLKPLTTHAKATASNVFGNQAAYGADKAIDGRDDTRWATDSGVKSAWLEVDLGRPMQVSRALIKQAYPELHRVRKFAIEYFQDGQWKACYRGENLGPKLRARFTPVAAQRVRLNITEATDGPTLWEFEIFK